MNKSIVSSAPAQPFAMHPGNQAVRVLTFVVAVALAINNSVLAADASGGGGLDWAEIMGPVVFILIGIAFVWGMVLVQQGWAGVSRGEEGALKIIGGLGMAASPFIMYAVYQKLGIGAMAIDASTVTLN